MIYLKFLQYLKIGLKSTKLDLSSIQYFHKNSVSFSIFIFLLERYYNDENDDNNIENILKNLPSVFASRPMLFKIINNAIIKGYLSRLPNKSDKRKFNIVLSKQSVKDFEEWALLFKNL